LKKTRKGRREKGRGEVSEHTGVEVEGIAKIFLLGSRAEEGGRKNNLSSLGKKP